MSGEKTGLDRRVKATILFLVSLQSLVRVQRDVAPESETVLDVLAEGVEKPGLKALLRQDAN